MPLSIFFRKKWYFYFSQETTVQMGNGVSNGKNNNARYGDFLREKNNGKERSQEKKENPTSRKTLNMFFSFKKREHFFKEGIFSMMGLPVQYKRQHAEQSGSQKPAVYNVDVEQKCKDGSKA